MKTKQQLYLAAVLSVVCLAPFATAQSWPPGSLSSTSSTTSQNIGNNCTVMTTKWTWTFTDTSGGKHAFAGPSVRTIYLSPTHSCFGGSTPPENEWSTDNQYYLQATAGTGSITEVGGYLNPKYVILGITYGPPGPQSFVNYTNSTLVGTESDITNSFKSGYTFSVTVQASVGGWGADGSFSGTSSTSYSQESDTSSTVTIDKETTRSYQTPGPSNAYAPVNHDYDIIWLWLNPVVRLAFPGNSNGITGVQWLGYGFSSVDPVGDVDVYPVYVGWLNGDIPIPSNVQQILARTWAGNEVYASGQGPGLTGPGTVQGTDFYNILQADKYGMCTPQPATCPTTVDATRFTGPISGEDFVYQQPPPGGQPLTQTYTDTYTNTTTQGQGAKYTFGQSFGLEQVFNVGIFGIGLKTTLQQQFSLDWEHDWESKITHTSTSSAELSITGPPCVVSGSTCNPVYTTPSQFNVYQDNIYGTFLFIPLN